MQIKDYEIRNGDHGLSLCIFEIVFSVVYFIKYTTLQLFLFINK